MAGWPIEKRKQKILESTGGRAGALTRIASELGEDKRFVSRVLHDKADEYDAMRVHRAQKALAAQVSVSRATMFGEQ